MADRGHPRYHSPGLLGVAVTYGIPLLVMIIGIGTWLALR